MSDWLHDLPVLWMAVVIFSFTYALSAIILFVVIALGVGDRARSFKAMSPGILSPLGVIFGLFVAFTAAQVWNDSERAATAVNREASALRNVVILATAFPGQTEQLLRSLVRDYVEETSRQEWPLMARHAASLRIAPQPLVKALQSVLAENSTTQGQQIAQREITASLETALDARRQRIIVSRSQVNGVKWLCLLLQAACALVAIAIVQSDNRVAAGITMAIFATGVAASLLLIAAHDRPFTGEISVRPDLLLQVLPETEAGSQGPTT